jgi:hypothetical protein
MELTRAISFLALYHFEKSLHNSVILISLIIQACFKLLTP